MIDSLAPPWCCMRSCDGGGYGIDEASALAPFEDARLPFAALYGSLLFAEVPDLYTMAGALMIVASTLYIARREHVLSRQGAGHAAKDPHMDRS